MCECECQIRANTLKWGKWNEYICLKIEYHYDWNGNYVFCLIFKESANNSAHFACAYANSTPLDLCFALHAPHRHLRYAFRNNLWNDLNGCVWSCRIVIDSFRLIVCAPFSFRMPFWYSCILIGCTHKARDRKKWKMFQSFHMPMHLMKCGDFIKFANILSLTTDANHTDTHTHTSWSPFAERNSLAQKCKQRKSNQNTFRTNDSI